MTSKSSHRRARGSNGVLNSSKTKYKTCRQKGRGRGLLLYGDSLQKQESQPLKLHHEAANDVEEEPRTLVSFLQRDDSFLCPWSWGSKAFQNEASGSSKNDEMLQFQSGSFFAMGPIISSKKRKMQQHLQFPFQPGSCFAFGPPSSSKNKKMTMKHIQFQFEPELLFACGSSGSSKNKKMQQHLEFFNQDSFLSEVFLTAMGYEAKSEQKAHNLGHTDWLPSSTLLSFS